MFQDFDFNNTDILTASAYWVFMALTIALSIIGLVYIFYHMKKLKRLESGSEEMVKIHELIRSGSNTYLKRQFKTISIVLVVLFVLIIFVNIPLAISFLVGAITSLVASYISMVASTTSNVKVTQACKNDLPGALKIGFNAGMIIGVAVISISLLGISSLYITFNFSVTNILGFAFGASFSALFAQLGGGIFTKGADIGADLVGKLEQGLPEDDIRNPAAIADNVGDNVGDCAGRGADLFESSSANNIAAMIIGVTLSLITNNPLYIVFSLITRALGNLASVFGGYFVKMKKSDKSPITAFARGLSITAGLNIIIFLVMTLTCFNDGWLYLFLSALIGIALGLSTYFIVDYYTSSRYKPVKEVIKNSETGAATNVISGFSLGLESPAIPVISFVLAIIITFFLGEQYGTAIGIDPYLGGVFGITVATLGLLSITTIILAFDGFGPVSDNAAGIAEMSHQGEEVRYNLDRLDAVGNTTKALAKGFGITCAALSAIILFEAYLEEIKATDVNIYHPVILCSLLIGAVIPFLFSALAIKAAGKSAYGMIKEIQRQFRDDPGILQNKSLPDYASCIDIGTKVALKQMIVPALLCTLTPILIGFLFGPIALAAFLISGTISGIILGFVLNTGGGALDNTKKAIEGGLLGGKGSIAHSASVVGDTFGDPLKDTAGPSLHILVKVINTVSIAFAPLFILVGGIIML
ncbi:MAG: sodium-translocating pyrophosphatase [Candidatus Lokiarchaeota archaeon]|nr:sodium-translocating pyrophosphatase [Candidatus Lokiarchaeota archaeon]